MPGASSNRPLNSLLFFVSGVLAAYWTYKAIRTAQGSQRWQYLGGVGLTMMLAASAAESLFKGTRIKWLLRATWVVAWLLAGAGLVYVLKKTF